MDILQIYSSHLKIATTEFAHLIENGEIIVTPGGPSQKLRLTIIDGSLIDVFLSESGRYSYHWERRTIGRTLYRHDNAPHQRWQHIETFPKHFHNGSESDQNCQSSYIDDRPGEPLRSFLRFAGEKLSSL